MSLFPWQLLSCWLLLLVVTTSQTQAGEPMCMGRKMYTASSGVISDGAGQYNNEAHCEWLISAQRPGQYISLEFVSMITECGYDYLFIYDGESYSSPMLGSFSGKSTPDPVLAKSGHMLVYFFSDRNYKQNGFNAFYNITDCPFNCSGHGNCELGSCKCEHGFRGEACDYHFSLCTHGTLVVQKCYCYPGWMGHRCNVSINQPGNHSEWFTVAPSLGEFTPRSGHSGAYVPSLNSLCFFGGSTLNAILDELICYHVNTSSWQVVHRTAVWPRPRHDHAMVLLNNKLYVYGGILEDKSDTDEFWVFDIDSGTWSLYNNSIISPKPRSSHTLTVVENQWIYLFGGRTADSPFMSSMYRIDVLAISPQWQQVVALGGKESNRSLVGHSTVYHPPSRSLLVFGGMLPDNAQFHKRSNSLNAFHVDERYWTQLEYNHSSSNKRPQLRAFHTATIMGNYMVVFGGNTHIHHSEEVCYDHSIFYYHLGCHRWVDVKELEPDVEEHRTPQGRFSHVGVAAFGDMLFVSGGYRGNMLGDLMALRVPLAIARNQNDTNSTSNICGSYKILLKCKADPECIWCNDRISQSGRADCIPRSQIHECKEAVMGSCPGICSTLKMCLDCTVQGKGASGPNPHGLWQNEPCAWCVKQAQCQKQSERQGVCHNQRSTPSESRGWWGGLSRLLNSTQQCQILDKPAGLHLLEFRHPANWEQPDQVSLVREAGKDFEFSPLIDQETKAQGKYSIALRGFIYPGALPANPIKVHLAVTTAFAHLSISCSDSPREQVKVVDVTQPTTYRIIEASPNEEIFPNRTEAARYYVDLSAAQLIAGPNKTQSSSTVELLWQHHTGVRKVITYESLEPFGNGSCSLLKTCLACMTDTLCGWCPLTNYCLPRVSLNASREHHLVMDSRECSVCEDFVDCKSCVETGLYEWLVPKARCVRAGRFAGAVRNVSQCPTPCRQRDSCEYCLSERNECAWCEQSNTCFAFMEYVMGFKYGGCTWWIDSQSRHQCRKCSRHNTCRDCLTEHQCGWCGNSDNPTIGGCVEGDFTDMGGDCSNLISNATQASEVAPADWSYGMCPDVDECRLNLHNCHENATCENTYEGFNCTCNRGYRMMDDGLTCEPTCYHDCIHGNCSGPPDQVCVCDIGWTGVDCNSNCGCHNHSTCTQGVGVCDECQHWTTGEHCQMCLPGSYGNATTVGCTLCQCNGHGDAEAGMCHSLVGVCHCKDNTEGKWCQFCQEGFYGDPSNGGQCYRQCDRRSILYDITSGALGSHAGVGVSDPTHAYCLWILTVYPNLTIPSHQAVTPTITFTLEPDFKTYCSRDFLYVYDGIPQSMGPVKPVPDVQLGAFCGHNQLEEPISVVATSGFLTVFYEGTVQETSRRSWGFNASYRVDRCPGDCHGNKRCVKGQCICAEGFGGIDCTTELCPSQCSSDLGQGHCDRNTGLCVCVPPFMGPACEIPHDPMMAMVEELYDPWLMGGATAFNSSHLRSGHTMMKCRGSPEAYVFGGFSLSHKALNDLWRYNLDTMERSEVIYATDRRPSARYMHAGVCIGRSLYIYGGFIEFGKASPQLWEFSLEDRAWYKHKWGAGSIIPPAMAGHSLVLISDTHFLLTGGFSTRNYFSQHSYLYDVSSRQWSRLEAGGTKPIGLYGHTSVYRSDSNTVYVFGGYRYQVDKTAASKQLYALHLQQNWWSLLPPQPHNQPTERYFHTAVDLSNYMVVMAGRTNEDDYDNSVFLYKYDCNLWVNASNPGMNLVGELPGVINAGAVVHGNSVYTTGGFGRIMHGGFHRITLPSDPCNIISNPLLCLHSSGCTPCAASDANVTYCYQSNGPRPTGCITESTSVSVRSDTSCNMTRPLCSDYKTCGECLSRWPVYSPSTPLCHWCSECEQGHCVASGKSCPIAPCSQKIIQADQCMEEKCHYTDCEKCGEVTDCVWTRQFRRTSESNNAPSEIGHEFKQTPLYEWNCVAKSLRSAIDNLTMVESSPPLGCPKRCYDHDNCADCLGSLGGEGGAQKCVWSNTLKQCMPPVYQPLQCSHGECGHVITDGPADQCPLACNSFTQCSTCLTAPGCGWCYKVSQNGEGWCMEGGMTGPHVEHCNGFLLDGKLGDKLYTDETQWNVDFDVEWSFDRCPPEDECRNGHHTCDTSQECVDRPSGYRCDCKDGYMRQYREDKCSPVCVMGCEPHGVCVEPNKCNCHFGYVGANCSLECECNKHSDCDGVNALSNCTGCHNNTVGDTCEKCKPLYVGNPRNGGECTSCYEFCNHHSYVCLHEETRNATLNTPAILLHRKNITQWLTQGPIDRDHTFCNNCQNNTEGTKCESCRRGYFRLLTQLWTEKDPCQPCECQGHSDICKVDSGTDCDCQNNTKSPRCDSEADSKTPCYKQQCSQCVENFLGTPTQGHQCYRQMTVDREYCFDPTTQMDCSREPTPLRAGRTVFFAVQPKYLNVDIRIVLDVTQGGVDVFFTNKDDAYLVHVDSASGLHQVDIDPKYMDQSSQRSRRSSQRSRRAPASNATTHSTAYLVEEYESRDFNSFIVVNHPNRFLMVRGVKDRLIITLPNNVHNLKTERFYLVLRGIGAGERDTQGALFFRQDQLHIDLFVFFSVFFSCFFLFLAVCVLLWKSKQAFDSHRSRHQRRLEMEHMASRPFAKSLVLMDYLGDVEPQNEYPSFPRRPRPNSSGTKHRLPKMASKYSLGSNVGALIYPDNVDSFNINPIALEPTDDGIAAVGTFIIQLPGSATAPVNACLGSALITMRVMYPNPYHIAPKAAPRRMQSSTPT